MEDYSYIINEEVHTEQSRVLVRKMIPIMIGWAKKGQTDRTYKDMTHLLGYNRYSGIGRTLGRVEDVIDRLRHESGKKDIPSLNALCKSEKTKLPSEGFSYVYDGYKNMPLEAKRIFVDGLNLKAVRYENWDWVLKVLGLQPLPVLTDDALQYISKPVYGSGGEGPEHKKLKEYIVAHPQALGIRNVVSAETEYVLPSGDRLDVFFILKNGTHIAVEVKPATSPENDITRGVFQCVKYEATMKALRKLMEQGYEIQTYLAVGAEISLLNQKIADELGVHYMVVKMKD